MSSLPLTGLQNNDRLPAKELWMSSSSYSNLKDKKLLIDIHEICVVQPTHTKSIFSP